MKLLRNYRLWFGLTLISLIASGVIIMKADIINIIIMPTMFLVNTFLMVLTFVMWGIDTKFNH
jgi:hypothetical protein